MYKEDSIIIKAPRASIFEAAADLSQWPRILPHYRWIRYLEKSPYKNVVVMGAKRGWIPIQWTSEQEIDYDRCEVRFRHLKAFTKGMNVVWTFKETSEGVHVNIAHDLKSTIPLIGSIITEWIIGDFFIHYVANKTLLHMKIYLETVPSLNPSPAGEGRVGS